MARGENGSPKYITFDSIADRVAFGGIVATKFTTNTRKSRSTFPFCFNISVRAEITQGLVSASFFRQKHALSAELCASFGRTLFNIPKANIRLSVHSKFCFE